MPESNCHFEPLKVKLMDCVAVFPGWRLQEFWRRLRHQPSSRGLSALIAPWERKEPPSAPARGSTALAPVRGPVATVAPREAPTRRLLARAHVMSGWLAGSGPVFFFWARVSAARRAEVWVTSPAQKLNNCSIIMLYC